MLGETPLEAFPNEETRYSHYPYRAERSVMNIIFMKSLYYGPIEVFKHTDHCSKADTLTQECQKFL